MNNSRGRRKQALGFALASAILVNGCLLTDRSAAADTALTRPKSIAIAPFQNKTSSLHASDAFAKLPLSFEANVGQADSKATFVSRGLDYTIALNRAEAILTPASSGTLKVENTSAALSSKPTAPRGDLRMKLNGANPASRVEGVDRLAGKFNYFIGNNRSNWLTGVPTYGKVMHRGVYRGIDLVYYGTGQQLEYDFIVAPGADPNAISIDFEGAQRARVSDSGELVLDTEFGEVRQHTPFAYQESNGVRKEVAARIEIKGKHRVSFRVGSYDRKKPLVIDPVLVYSTYYANGRVGITDIAADAAGNVYVTGYGLTTALQATPGAVQGANGQFSVIVSKLNAEGTAIIYSSILGGQTGSTDSPRIAVDGEGNAYVCGNTTSTDYPTTPGALQTASHGPGIRDGFVTKLNSTGSSMVYSTYLGGSSGATPEKIQVDAAGNAFIVGSTNSNNFPVTVGAFQQQKSSSFDAFVTKLNAAGSAVVYSTFLGGTAWDRAYGVALDSGGNAYVTGYTVSTDFPTTVGAVQPSRVAAELSDGHAAFVAKLSATGSELIYSTYLGDSSTGKAIAVDALGQAYVAGRVHYDTFPTVNALQSTHPAAFFAKSGDGGSSWSPSVEGLPKNGAIRNPVIDPQDPSRMYVVVAPGVGGGFVEDGDSLPGPPTGPPATSLFRSIDGGNHWNAIGNGLPTTYWATSLTADPSNPATLYVGMYLNQGGAVYKSTDHGDNWTRISSEISGYYLRINPTTPSTLYSTTNHFKLAKSTDGGVTWHESTQGMATDETAITAIAVHPTMHSIVFATSLEKIFRSTDGGDTWNAMADIAGGNTQIVFNPTLPSTMYIVTSKGDNDASSDDGRGNPRKRSALTTIYEGAMKSTDSGSTWNSINTGLPVSFVPYAMVLDPASPSTLYIGSAQGLFKTINGGNSWFLHDRFINGSALAVRSDGPTSLFAGVFLSGPSSDAFVSKLNSAGTALVYSTFLGGLAEDSAHGIAVDAGGNAYIAGFSGSKEFPIISGAFQQAPAGDFDAFVAKLNSTGTVLDYSTFLGGQRSDLASGIALDSAGNIYVAGLTQSLDFPTVNPLQPALPDPTRPSGGFVTKISTAAPAPSNLPTVTSAQVSGKKLFVYGARFGEGAVILLNGDEQKTTNQSQNSSTTLVGKKAGKKISQGEQVLIRVRNVDGTMSNLYSFTRPVE